MDFPSNSKATVPSEEEKGAPEKKVVLKVVEGEAIRRPQTMMSRFRAAFFGPDVKANINNAITNVLIPTAKDAAFDMFVNTLRQAAYGGSSSETRRAVGNIGTRLVGNALNHTNYNQFSGRSGGRGVTDYQGTTMGRQARAQHNFEEIILPTRRDAAAVLETMRDLIEHYGSCTVSDLYDLVGEQSDFTDQKWGWTDITDARPRPVRSGFLLDLDRPQPLKLR